MSKIHVLPNHIINQIAAGEVVERPASILKELLENSVDANATEIKISVEDGGIKSIKIVDNGTGMSPEDARTAFLPHSTSKLKNIEDLNSLFTLGFRGEALASISSVSKIELVTKQEGEISGYQVKMDAGEVVEESESGAVEGTSINVQEIFFNTPARKKFLKTVPTELRHIIKTFTDTVIAHPEIRFSLDNNEKKLYDLPATKDLKERLRNLIGEDFTNNSFEIVYDGIVKITGLVGLPKIATSRKNTQIIIVNDRPISNTTISAGVKDAFHSAIANNQYPQFVLNIKLDPSKVDVNVHPRKQEVRFSNQQEIFKAVRNAVKAGLQRALQEDTDDKLAGVPYISKPSAFSPSFEKKESDGVRDSFSYESKRDKTSVQDSLSFTKNLFDAIPEKTLPWENEDFEAKESLFAEKQTYPVYQLMNAYLITSNGTAIQIIDQHAAAERVTYEKLMKSVSAKKVEMQSLLIPFELELNAQELLILAENLEYLSDFGIQVEEFGMNSFVVRQIPVELKDSDLNAFVKELIQDLTQKEEDEQNQYEKLKENILTTMACHSSVRVGDHMSQQEIEQLVADLKSCDLPYSCPHGRPIIFEVPISELDKKFKRT